VGRSTMPLLFAWVIGDVLHWPICLFLFFGIDLMLLIIHTVPDIPREYPDPETVRMLIHFIRHEIPDFIPTLVYLFWKLFEFDHDLLTLLQNYQITVFRLHFLQKWVYPLNDCVQRLYWQSQYMQSELYQPLKNQNHLFHWWLIKFKVGGMNLWEVKTPDNYLYSNLYPKRNPLEPGSTQVFYFLIFLRRV
jgi:hypothetical protein